VRVGETLPVLGEMPKKNEENKNCVEVSVISDSFVMYDKKKIHH
jgi:hypothetical protein